MKNYKLKTKCVFLTLFMLGFTSFSYGQTANSDVLLSNKILNFNETELKLEFTIENKGGENIFIATNPSQVMGKKGYYLILDESDETLLKVSGCVYPAPPYFPIIDARGVLLKKVTPNEIYTDTISIKLPAKETDPPFYRKETKRETIVAEKINRVELTIGYFVEEKGILDFLKLKPYGWYISGQENLDSGDNKGKSFLDIQNLVSVEISTYITPNFLTKNRKK